MSISRHCHSQLLRLQPSFFSPQVFNKLWAEYLKIYIIRICHSGVLVLFHFAPFFFLRLLNIYFYISMCHACASVKYRDLGNAQDGRSIFKFSACWELYHTINKYVQAEFDDSIRFRSHFCKWVGCMLLATAGTLWSIPYTIRYLIIIVIQLARFIYEQVVHQAKAYMIVSCVWLYCIYLQIYSRLSTQTACIMHLRRHFAAYFADNRCHLLLRPVGVEEDVPSLHFWITENREESRKISVFPFHLPIYLLRHEFSMTYLI